MNADYTNKSFLSSLYLNYKKDFAGFGDFTVQSMDYEPSSGANARNIVPAMHSTVLKDNYIMLHHYKTTPIEKKSFKKRMIITVYEVLRGKKDFYHALVTKELECKMLRQQFYLSLKK